MHVAMSRGPILPKILYKIVATIFQDCKIVTLPEQLLYVAHDVTCGHMIYRPFRTLIHENFREMVFIKTVKLKRDCKFLVEISKRLYKIMGPLSYVAIRILKDGMQGIRNSQKSCMRSYNL